MRIHAELDDSSREVRPVMRDAPSSILLLPGLHEASGIVFPASQIKTIDKNLVLEIPKVPPLDDGDRCAAPGSRLLHEVDDSLEVPRDGRGVCVLHADV